MLPSIVRMGLQGQIQKNLIKGVECAGVKARPLGGSGGMLPQENFEI